MKTLNDIKNDMSDLYEQLKSGTTELKTASELANIAGKYLKAEQLDLAREIFMANQPKAIPSNDSKTIDMSARKRKVS
jgi:hypothetical protein